MEENRKINFFGEVDKLEKEVESEFEKLQKLKERTFGKVLEQIRKENNDI